MSPPAVTVSVYLIAPLPTIGSTIYKVINEIFLKVSIFKKHVGIFCCFLTGYSGWHNF